MAAIPIDTDIASAPSAPATGSLALDKINAQAYRNALAAQAAYQSARLQIEQASLDLARAQRVPTVRELVMLALVDRFMTESSSTVPATYTAVSQADGARLRVAIDEAIKAAQ
jgi:hypothetical protein